MRRRLFLAAFAAAAGVCLTLPAASALQAAPQGDWTQTVVETPEGGFRMGSPNAPVKLIEYGSLGCPTCARFETEGKAPLTARIRSGDVSFEFRNYVLSPADMAATLLSRCGGPSLYFRLNEAFLRSQTEWSARLQAAPEATLAEIAKLPPEQQMVSLARLAGLEAIAAKQGIAPAKAKQCLSDPAAIDRLVAMKRAAWATYRVRGTPTFVVNGQPAAGVHGWTALAPLLKAGG